MTISRDRLHRFLDALLRPEEFADYGPNGLQVEGRTEINRVAFAVSATARSAADAVAFGADALVVHHGLFWKFHGPRPLVGPFARRVFPLVRNEINLFAYHLPLDAHPEVGNAATLGHKLGLVEHAPFGDYQGCPTGVRGLLAAPTSARVLRERLVTVLDHPVLLSSPDETRIIRSLGIITGGAHGDWALAVQQGLDAYLTGEMREHDWHEAQEAGVHLFAGGHHATERFGIQALMERVRMELALECIFLPSDNPA
jgi:dinuclear metal center YbgI/SA1388 family protein